MTAQKPKQKPDAENTLPAPPQPQPGQKPAPTPESGGPKGPEPTRYGDWERDGKCVDF